MDEFILDNSVTMAWCFDDEASPYAEALLELMPRSSAFVPALWPLEVASVLLVGERRKRITPAGSSEILDLLRGFEIRIDHKTANEAWETIVDLARSHGISAYDAADVELALRMKLPIATLDGKLEIAALAAGVAIHGAG